MYRSIKVSSSILGRPSSLLIRRNASIRYSRASKTPSKPSSGGTSSPKPSTSNTAAQPQAQESSSTNEPTNSKSNDTSEVFKLHDAPLDVITPAAAAPSTSATSHHVDWSDSFHGLGSQAFSREIIDILLAPLDPQDIEIKPDGLLYLPEIKYRRTLNRAFGPGGWGMAPRSESMVLPGQISREYALVCHGRLVSIARGEQDYFGGQEKVTTALEGCKSNALMRCCKDLGIASELWDPSFIRKFKKEYCDDVFAEHVNTKKKKKLWKLKSVKTLDYPYKIV
ncbi:Mitochondrial genome maintenance protein [Spathaspora sp. JA1]|nr:Mitochondrial genome maintenance protein [Spathaspora sp. JA1]